jgi:hypothetical protein
MYEADQTSKPSPARHRGNQNPAKLGQKMYLSENDIPSQPIMVHDHIPLPRTPQKSVNGSPLPSSFLSNNTAQKQRTRTKIRPKNGLNSPEASRTGRHTPPPTVLTKSSTAFAGATFHASPAPSALPIPKFYAKGAPESPSFNTKLAPTERTPTTDNEAPTSYRSHMNFEPRESPLELIFRADREEKEKARLTNSTTSQRRINDFECSPSASLQAQGHVSTPNFSINSNQRLEKFNHGESGSRENTPNHGVSRPIGPAFSTPYQQRIRAARAEPAGVSPSPQASPRVEDRSDRSEALKQYLFGGQSTFDASQQRQSSPSVKTQLPAYNASGNTSSYQHGGRASDVLTLEDNLKRLLKLDSAS